MRLAIRSAVLALAIAGAGACGGSSTPAAPSPPGHGNFPHPPEVFRGPYEYSVPGESKDFTPQNEPDGRSGRPRGVPQPAGAH